MIHLERCELPYGARGVLSGRDLDGPALPVGAPGNLAHRRPHRPADLAGARREVAAATDTEVASWHLLHQVHGAAVARVDATVPAGTELRGVDAAVTALTDRPLVVQTADCVGVLLAAPGAVGVAHAGRAGVLEGVVPAAVTALRELASHPQVVAVLGPAIGGCCYEVPVAMRAAAEERCPGIGATTTWGTPSLDLPAAVRRQLAAVDVEVVGSPAPCTYTDERFFSHRRDPASGRQVGLIVRSERVGSAS